MAKEENKKRGRGRPRKKKVEEEENINEETQAETSSDDDSFGLPDIELKPLEEVEESSDELEDTEAASEEDVEEPVAESSDSGDEDLSEEFEDGDSDENTESEEGQDAEEEDQPAYTRRYEYEEPKSNGPKILMAILGVIIIVAGVYYFGFYAPEQKRQAEKAAQEQAERDRLAEQERQRKAQEEQRAQELAAQQQAEEEEQASAKPEPGEINILTASTGRYYVVIGSFIDDDLAMDYGQKLAAEGTGSMILSPVGATKFYRLALSDHASFNEAQQEADNLKSSFSDALWVLKY